MSSGAFCKMGPKYNFKLHTVLAYVKIEWIVVVWWFLIIVKPGVGVIKQIFSVLLNSIFFFIWSSFPLKRMN